MNKYKINKYYVKYLYAENIIERYTHIQECQQQRALHSTLKKHIFLIEIIKKKKNKRGPGWAMFGSPASKSFHAWKTRSATSVVWGLEHVVAAYSNRRCAHGRTNLLSSSPRSIMMIEIILAWETLFAAPPCLNTITNRRGVTCGKQGVLRLGTGRAAGTGANVLDTHRIHGVRCTPR